MWSDEATSSEKSSKSSKQRKKGEPMTSDEMQAYVTNYLHPLFTACATLQEQQKKKNNQK